MNSRTDLLLAAAVYFLLSTQPASAYIDPGTGSILLQMIVGGIFALAFTVKMYWRKIKAKLFGASGEESDDDEIID